MDTINVYSTYLSGWCVLLLALVLPAKGSQLPRPGKLLVLKLVLPQHTQKWENFSQWPTGRVYKSPALNFKVDHICSTVCATQAPLWNQTEASLWGPMLASSFCWSAALPPLPFSQMCFPQYITWTRIPFSGSASREHSWRHHLYKLNIYVC